jgi:hypothetical protein
MQIRWRIERRRGVYRWEETYRSGNINRRILRGYIVRLESVGLGLIRKLVYIRRETTFLMFSESFQYLNALL